MSVNRKVWVRSVLGTVFAASLGACATAGDLSGPLPAAHVIALSTYSAPVGTPITIYGTNFPSIAQGRVMLTFKGGFVTTDGRTLPVDTGLMEARAVGTGDTGMVRWRSFGPFFNPLATSDPSRPPETVVGEFRGRVFAHIVAPSGLPLAEDMDGTPITFRVEPSLVVTELQPIGANCGLPARVGLSRMPYRLAVQALGFTPRTITYTMEGPPQEWGADNARVTIQHVLDGSQTGDLVGENGELPLPGVPYNRRSYTAVFRVDAVDTEGRPHSLAFGLDVHRPVETIATSATPIIRQREQPTAVTGCVYGGATGLNVTYEESTAETKMRTVDVHYSNGWTSSFTVSMGGSFTDTVEHSVTVGNTLEWGTTVTDSNSVALSQTEGGGYNWSNTQSHEDVMVRGSTTGAGWNQTGTTTWDQNWNASVSTTANIGSSWTPVSGSVTATGGVGGSQGGSYAGGTTGDTTTYNMDTTSIGSMMTMGGERNWSTMMTNTMEHSVAQTQSNTLSRMESQSISRAETTTYDRQNMESTNREVSQGYSDSNSTTLTIGNNLMGHIPATTHGVWYRQATERVTVSELRAYNLCGTKQVLGEVLVSDWIWNTELALTDLNGSCDGSQLPQPRGLPAAGCFHETCQ